MVFILFYFILFYSHLTSHSPNGMVGEDLCGDEVLFFLWRRLNRRRDIVY